MQGGGASTRPGAAPLSSKWRAEAQGQRPGSQSSPSEISGQAPFLFSQSRAALEASVNIFLAGRQGLLSACQLPRRSRGAPPSGPRGLGVESSPRSLGARPGVPGPLPGAAPWTWQQPRNQPFPPNQSHSRSHPSLEMNGGSIVKVVIFIIKRFFGAGWRRAPQRQGRNEIWGK